MDIPKYNRAGKSLFKKPKIVKLDDRQRKIVHRGIELAGSRAELARQSKVNEMTIYTWLVNANRPRKASLEKIKKYVDKMEKTGEY